jgi:hypothetical protein
MALTPPYSLLTRTAKGSQLTIEELDGNLLFLASTLSGSNTITGSVNFTGSLVDFLQVGTVTGSFSGDGSGLTGVTATLPVGVVSSSLQFTNTDDVTFRNITASGNISASGFIQAASTVYHAGVIISASNSEGDPRDSQMIVPPHGFEIKNSEHNNVLKIAYDHVGINTPNPGNLDYALRVSGSDGGTKAIEAIGDISSSGIVYGTTGSFNYVTTPIIEGSGSTTLLHIEGDVSASGNITAVSMSGDGSGLTGITATLPAGVVSSSLQFTNTDDVTFRNITASNNIKGVDLILTGGDIDLKNDGAQSNIRFYCEVGNAHYTKLQAAPHSEYSGNPTTTLPTYDFDFASPNFQGNVTVTGSLSSSGNITAVSMSGDGSGLTGIPAAASPGTVSSSAQIENLGFANTSSVDVYLNFEEARSYAYIVPYNLQFAGFTTSSAMTVQISSSGAPYVFTSSLSQFAVLSITSSAAGLITLSGSRL